MYLHIPCILEAVIAVLKLVVNTYVRKMNEEIIEITYHNVLQCDVTAVPKHLLPIAEVRVPHRYVLHSAKHLRRINLAICHPTAFGIPQTGPCALCEITVSYIKSVCLPKDILPLKGAVDSLYIGRLLYRRLSYVYRHVLKSYVT